MLNISSHYIEYNPKNKKKTNAKKSNKRKKKKY